MFGLILCGGQSSRMGTDKARLGHQGVSWAEQAIAKLASLQLQSVLSVNEDQFELYSRLFSSQPLVKDKAGLDVQGPLKGVLSAHQAYPTETMFVLACDMPLIDTSLLKALYDCYEKEKPEACLFANEDQYEPLCAIYAAGGLARIMELQQAGLLQKHSMKYMIDRLSVISLPVKPAQKRFFFNFNSPDDLKDL
jgi:molybdopterin-guanine dinucleotide biosynthesis protein A